LLGLLEGSLTLGALLGICLLTLLFLLAFSFLALEKLNLALLLLHGLSFLLKLELCFSLPLGLALFLLLPLGCEIQRLGTSTGRCALQALKRALVVQGRLTGLAAELSLRRGKRFPEARTKSRGRRAVLRVLRSSVDPDDGRRLLGRDWLFGGLHGAADFLVSNRLTRACRPRDRWGRHCGCGIDHINIISFCLRLGLAGARSGRLRGLLGRRSLNNLGLLLFLLGCLGFCGNGLLLLLAEDASLLALLFAGLVEFGHLLGIKASLFLGLLLPALLLLLALDRGPSPLSDWTCWAGRGPHNGLVVGGGAMRKIRVRGVGGHHALEQALRRRTSMQSQACRGWGEHCRLALGAEDCAASKQALGALNDRGQLVLNLFQRAVAEAAGRRFRR
jgi:hypothetical protein